MRAWIGGVSYFGGEGGLPRFKLFVVSAWVHWAYVVGHLVVTLGSCRLHSGVAFGSLWGHFRHVRVAVDRFVGLGA